MADSTGTHFEGLTQATRKVRLTPALSRHLRQLDICTAWLRHVTQPKCQSLLSNLRKELQCLGGSGHVDPVVLPTDLTGAQTVLTTEPLVALETNAVLPRDPTVALEVQANLVMPMVPTEALPVKAKVVRPTDPNDTLVVQALEAEVVLPTQAAVKAQVEAQTQATQDALESNAMPMDPTEALAGQAPDTQGTVKAKAVVGIGLLLLRTHATGICHYHDVANFTVHMEARCIPRYPRGPLVLERLDVERFTTPGVRVDVEPLSRPASEALHAQGPAACAVHAQETQVRTLAVASVVHAQGTQGSTLVVGTPRFEHLVAFMRARKARRLYLHFILWRFSSLPVPG